MIEDLSSTTPTSSNINFEDVVIGSSPLMIIHAIKLAESGKKVCILERSDHLGGNWQISSLEGGDKVEIACHLIEVFPKVYELLEQYSGVPFLRLDKQPIRITKRGHKVAYVNRMLLLASGLRLIFGLFKAYFDFFIGTTFDRNNILNFQNKLESYLRYQLPSFFQPLIVRGPRDGFANFTTKLYERACSAGVVFEKIDVLEMKLGHRKLWYIKGSNGEVMTAPNVHVTTSTNLKWIGQGQVIAGPTRCLHRVAVAVDVPRKNILVNQSYVAFWSSPYVARIARIDYPGQLVESLRFLVEFHDNMLGDVENWRELIRESLEHASIIRPNSTFDIAGKVECAHIANVDQFPSGLVDHNLWGHYSKGNLAAGLARWHRSANF